MKKFLLLQSRPEVQVSDDEFRAFCRFGGMKELEVERLQIHLEQPSVDLSKYRAVLMGGGPANFSYPDDKKSAEQKAFEPWLWELLDRIIAQDVPFFGACLGIGALVTHGGGEMSLEMGEAVGAVPINTNPDIKNDVLKGVPSTFSAFVGHKEGVLSIPDNATVLASNDNCVQMIRVGQHAYATQFHPELDPEGLALRIEAYRFAGYFEPEEADQLIFAARQSDVDETAGLVLKNFINKYR